ncbi:DUF1127 domain-containing protein [Pseudomonadota bacterium]
MNHTVEVRISSAWDARFGVLAWIDRVAKILETLETWNQRHKTRQQLAKLDDRMLKDIGISDAQRFIESKKRFWEK